MKDSMYGAASHINITMRNVAKTNKAAVAIWRKSICTIMVSNGGLDMASGS